MVNRKNDRSAKRAPSGEVMVPDMSQVELKTLAHQLEHQDVDINTHLSLVTGAERGVIKAMRFSEVYGSGDNRDELIRQHGKGYVIKLTLDFLATFPVMTGKMRFRKERSRLMLKALVEKVAQRKHLEITYDGTYFRFSYRGYVLICWNVVDDDISNVHADKYEDATSTFSQRTLAREAIHEFRKAVLGV